MSSKYISFGGGAMGEPKYHYLVDIYVSTHDDTGRNFEHTEVFDSSFNPDLLECRKAAISYYNEYYKGILDKGDFYGMRFAGYDKSIFGETARFSIWLKYVEAYDNGENYEYCISEDEGGGEIETELLILQQAGYNGLMPIVNFLAGQ